MTETTTCPKCGHRHPSRDEAGLLIPQCPACGIYYFKYINQQSNGSQQARDSDQRPNAERSQIPPPQPTPTDAERLLAYQELATHKTNHILHLLLSIVTAGIWLIPWFVLSADNTDKRNRIRQKYGLPIESNAAGNIIRFLMGVILVIIFVRGCYGH
jgi:predicted  nucleic acid-binding Zn-ribbon protein